MIWGIPVSVIGAISGAFVALCLGLYNIYKMHKTSGMVEQMMLDDKRFALKKLALETSTLYLKSITVLSRAIAKGLSGLPTISGQKKTLAEEHIKLLQKSIKELERQLSKNDEISAGIDELLQKTVAKPALIQIINRNLGIVGISYASAERGLAMAKMQATELENLFL